MAPLPARRVLLSHYVTRGRLPARAANDNRRPDSLPIWRMVLAVSAVPVVSALVILSILM
ncbi:hypothetical protein [Methylobacterium sp. J-068]|uniref:hypothetical protein n=1 Tax=Methylobacterium sp. J-068 TaxID=2836649 RepID=UPI001FBB1623|nr:hypothetical protein [Methylobacterium sp. J-068]MCJ2036031.1 hypothetical protein [Methylobacterium sp. J-068]